jgi:hypothetical protein
LSLNLIGSIFLAKLTELLNLLFHPLRDLLRRCLQLATPVAALSERKMQRGPPWLCAGKQ